MHIRNHSRQEPLQTAVSALATASIVAVLLIQAPAHAQLAPPKVDVPTLDMPANGATDWLFNLPQTGPRDKLSWKVVLNPMRYEVVISRSPTFSDAVETSVGVLCQASCAARFVTANSAKDTDFAGYWFDAGTTAESSRHYWRVRAWYAPGRASAWSTTRNFVITKNPNVIVQARKQSVSPASLATGPGRTWLDDTNGGDGALLISAMSDYRAAKDKALFNSKGVRTTLANTMFSRLTSSWSTANKWALVDQIAATASASAVPTTNQGVLDRLKIRAQCKEAADRAVADGGGNPRNTPGITGSTGVGAVGVGDARPGMYVFKRTQQTINGQVVWSFGHTALANAIRIESDGSRTARLSEANAGAGGWNNPQGEVPWLRSFNHTATYPLGTGSTSLYRAMY